MTDLKYFGYTGKDALKMYHADIQCLKHIINNLEIQSSISKDLDKLDQQYLVSHLRRMEKRAECDELKKRVENINKNLPEILKRIKTIADKTIE
ncbi:hypothetical protein CO154_02605 [Candidatus Pacearchaeota archaeon CG_4_9_14_3_um_filter_31_7]|nr:MAG: hypothetical protein AUJ10_04075 [Candidatus Pacearchaeota archaeon CG1_02_31_27]PIN91920.1 MAG: hypothetical protein COU55_03430 [Candidatus Pacearchaeota archaeon CG10_big_fil_rev_8_21_14_0_10_31_59]PIZ80479.1 MAG: hypothetical protein COX99_02285 [Candidatus Pacearchaeota archaeon CG_4_10_14_0_2_um_filter_31_10]PJA70499.1 MAG: hypothetical protein CO154_02605 [Candidatus Pacearchaeota archaeon CG_4_9_14_3_um_filter_31_7]